VARIDAAVLSQRLVPKTGPAAGTTQRAYLTPHPETALSFATEALAAATAVAKVPPLDDGIADTSAAHRVASPAYSALHAATHAVLAHHNLTHETATSVLADRPSGTTDGGIASAGVGDMTACAVVVAASVTLAAPPEYSDAGPLSTAGGGSCFADDEPPKLCWSYLHPDSAQPCYALRTDADVRWGAAPEDVAAGDADVSLRVMAFIFMFTFSY
jgi:hypothetical protein